MNFGGNSAALPYHNKTPMYKELPRLYPIPSEKGHRIFFQNAAWKKTVLCQITRIVFYKVHRVLTCFQSCNPNKSYVYHGDNNNLATNSVSASLQANPFNGRGFLSILVSAAIPTPSFPSLNSKASLRKRSVIPKIAKNDFCQTLYELTPILRCATFGGIQINHRSYEGSLSLPTPWSP